MTENIVGKGENAYYHDFLLFPQGFHRLSFSGSLKIWIVWLRVNGKVKSCSRFPHQPARLRALGNLLIKSLFAVCKIR